MTLRKRVCLFVRAPEAGRVKTRLASGMGPEAALQAYQRLVDHTVDRLRPDEDIARELWSAGNPAHERLQQWAVRWSARHFAQVGENLGSRMHKAIYHGRADTDPSPAACAVVGADCPGITTAMLKTAFDALDSGADVAVAPAEDGGYGLIAVRYRTPVPLCDSVFAAIDWGTDAVFAQTQDRCRELQLQLAELPTVWDVDWPADWQRFLETYGDD